MPVASACVLALGWLDGATRRLYGFVGSRQVHWWSNGGALVALARGVGATANGSGTDRWQWHQSHWHSPSRASTTFGCSSEHGEGFKERPKGLGEAGHGDAVVVAAWR